MPASREEVIEFLRRRSTLIVHFASVPPLVGPGPGYPQSLLISVCDRSRQLSCSVVQPGDSFGVYADTKNGTGTIGLIIRPRVDASVIAVAPKDAGSVAQTDGTRVFTPHEITTVTMEDSMERRGEADGPGAAYNEWGLGDYDVVGLFVSDPAENDVQLAGQSVPSTETIEDTINHFSELGLRIFTFASGSICELASTALLPVEHEELYA